MTPVQKYLKSVATRFKQGISSEHSYRSDLEVLLRELVKGISVTNEPSKVTDCGNPDYIITRNNIPVGYIEAKDIGKDLNGKQYKEQLTRYKNALDNLIVTDYIWFQFFNHGKLVSEVRIGQKLDERTIKLLPEHFEEFENLIQNFGQFSGQTIRSSRKLAEMMAAKARLLQHILEQAITSDEENQENTSLKGQYEAFKSVLIHDLSPKDFADIYAQTLAYGMFAARLHDPTLDTFTRQEAAELIPKSNPFLRRLFQYVAGYDIDERIRSTVDNLAEVFRSTNVEELLKSFQKDGQGEDPIIHFYEDFLAQYDPKLRKSRGVWYTPEPVVNFIVRAVDDILKSEFDLPLGLADTSTTRIQVNVQGKKVEKEVHKVQILDPATGTGTFLAEVVKLVHKKFEGQQGIWSNYVENHLIPRLNGFELLMASYAMAHLKLDLLLTETGFKPTKDQRLRVFLTNSLEEYHPDTGTLFANWVSSEANEANFIKRDTPVMVIIGNPPYSGESKNKGEWIMSLMEDYKKEPGGKEKLKEQNSKFINDDYVKFLRFGQHFVEKNGSGILAFINPHGFLDNPTYRGMRWHLLNTYDKIYTLDLHGNAKKKETAPDGSADINVFDIEQGVSINFFIKTGKKKPDELGQVFHYDLYGKRDLKYDFLSHNNLKSIEYQSFTPFRNSFLFKSIDESMLKKYNEGINPISLFTVNVMGFQTHRDSFAIDFEMKNIKSRALDLIDKKITNEELNKKYSISDNRDWKLEKARNEIQSDKNWESKAVKCGYRPFDERPCYFSYVMMDYPRKELIQNVLNKENILLGIGRQGSAVGDIDWCLTTVSKHPVDANIFRRGGVNLFPLYLYPDNSGQQTIEHTTKKIPNLNLEIVNLIESKIGLTFTSEKKREEKSFAPIDILDYIYAVLHSPSYRTKYKDFLKTDFPKIPYPKDPETFWQLVALGEQLREIHLLESPMVNNFITQYPVDGSNEVEKITYQDGKVFINATQHFDHVPEVAWSFYIGGYQPAQKWLKDRKGRQLDFNDILHYQRIIVALTETDRLMKEIDKVEIE
ncbi:MAG: N-6 DNA methylase [Bacteroidales bacterium]|nr:N-6 DNA methylase [Bacteroidales bacterium]